jgi:hypothetical protein
VGRVARILGALDQFVVTYNGATSFPHLVLLTSIGRDRNRGLLNRARENGLNLSGNQINADIVVPALWDYYISIALRRFDKLKVHRAHGRRVLRYDRFNRPASLVHITIQASYETDVRVGVYKYFQIHQRAHLRIDEYEYAFDDDYRSRLDGNSCGPSRVRGVIVNGLLDAFARAQRFDVIHHQVCVESIGVIEIDLVAQFYGHVAEVAVVRIVLKKNYVVAANRIYDLIGYCGLAGTSPAADTYYHSAYYTGFRGA